jgi:hypothetical protein
MLDNGSQIALLASRVIFRKAKFQKTWGVNPKKGNNLNVRGVVGMNVDQIVDVAPENHFSCYKGSPIGSSSGNRSTGGSPADASAMSGIRSPSEPRSSEEPPDEHAGDGLLAKRVELPPAEVVAVEDDVEEAVDEEDDSETGSSILTAASASASAAAAGGTSCGSAGGRAAAVAAGFALVFAVRAVGGLDRCSCSTSCASASASAARCPRLRSSRPWVACMSLSTAVGVLLVFVCSMETSNVKGTDPWEWPAQNCHSRGLKSYT